MRPDTVRELAQRLEDNTRRLERELAGLRDELSPLQTSRLWRWGHLYWALRRRLHRLWKRRTTRAAPSAGDTRRSPVSEAEPALPADAPPVSIVIVTESNLDACRRCLESLFRITRWPDVEVIIVDDASHDGTPAYLGEAQRDFPLLHVVLNAKREGLAAASDLGLARASGDVFVLLSDDSVVSRGWLAALVQHLTEDHQIGMMGAVSKAAIDDEPGLRVGYEHVENAALGLSCVALRREVYEEIGPLGEDPGMGNFEEYGRRVREAGYTIRRAHDALIHHEPVTRSRVRTAPGVVPARAREIRPLLDAAYRARGVVVFPPTVGWSLPLFQRPHHLARAFAAAGYAVVFDCSNSRDDVEHLREIERRLFLFRGGFDELHALRHALVWTFPYNVQAGLGFPGEARTIYDWIDDLSVFTGWDAGFVRSNHERALGSATLVTAVARPLHAEALRVRSDALYLPNAVDYDHFAGTREPTTDPKLAAVRAKGGPIAGYYGALAKWFDHDLLDEVAKLRPDWTFVLVGPNHEGGLRGARALRRPNVIWTGAREYRILPVYSAAFDVATIPFRVDPITTATSPLKLYEYFAAGKPVVATAMPECESFPEVRIVRSAPEFSAALDAARADAADPIFVERLRALGRENSWRERVTRVLAALDATERSSGAEGAS